MPRGGETGHEDVEIGGHGDVFLLVLISDFHEVVVDDGDVTDIQGVGIQESMEGLEGRWIPWLGSSFFFNDVYLLLQNIYNSNYANYTIHRYKEMIK